MKRGSVAAPSGAVIPMPTWHLLFYIRNDDSIGPFSRQRGRRPADEAVWSPDRLRSAL